MKSNKDYSMKYLLIFPPQWTPISPHFALPSLLGQLKSAGFDAEGMDLNIDFFNKVLTREYIQNSILRALDSQDELLAEIKLNYDPNKTFTEYSPRMQNIMVKYNEIKKYMTEKQAALQDIPFFIESAKQTLKSDDFYTPELLIKSASVIEEALHIVSLPFYPSKISIDNYSNPFLKLSYDSIKEHVFEKETNIFWEYFSSVMPKIKAKNACFLAISINSSSQLVPGLTLAYMLKKHTDAYVNIGGNYFGRVAEELKKKKEFFELFCESVSVEEGEGPVVQLAKYANGEIPVEEVPNLIYLDKESDEVKWTEKKPPLKLNKMANLCFDGYKMEDYFSPEIVSPFQTSRGCYWGKCSFCDQDFGQNFNVKDVEKVVAEMKELKEKYNISKFEFIDESISPTYMADFAKLLKQEKLDIQYFCDARLESSFTKEIFKDAHDTGLTMVMWGVESGSEKVMNLINKGIEVNKRMDILKDASDSGIWNFAFIFFGFPAETKEDALLTVKMLCENKDKIHSYGRSIYTMGKHSKLTEDPEKYGITEVFSVVDDFSPTVIFKAKGMTPQELHDVTAYCTQECSKAYGNPLWMYLRYREWLFLYIAKNGVKWVEDYKVKF